MEETILLVALEENVREEILHILRSETLTSILGYSATKTDAARKIAHNTMVCSQIEVTIKHHGLF